MSIASFHHDWRARMMTCVSPASLLALVFLVGCSGHRDKQQPQEDADLAVPECDAYVQRARACFHRADLEGAIATRAHDEAERDRMRASCALNLQRLSDACR